MASKRGIALTIGIGTAIIGSSFLIWYLPQSSQTAFDLPRTDEGTLSAVYSRNFALADEVDSKFTQWKLDQLSSEDMLMEITKANAEITSLKTELQIGPAQEWQESYDLYVQALDSFQKFLSVMEANVKQDNRDNDPELESLRVEWNNHVEDSVDAMPINN